MEINTKKLTFLIFLLLTIILFFDSFSIRVQMVENLWNKYPGSFIAKDGQPMMTTTDAYKWLRLAEAYELNNYTATDPLAFYPESNYVQPKPVPLLSKMLSVLTPTGQYFEQTGLSLIPILASLLIIPLAIYFYLAGMPIVGLIGGFLGSFGTYYFLRSTPGRLDTDALNVFFTVLTPLFIYLAAIATSRKKLFIFAALAGVSQFIFHHWYDHAIFALMFFCTLILILFLTKKPIKDIAIVAFLYFVCSWPPYLMEGILSISNYVVFYIIRPDALNTGGELFFPNVYSTITEQNKNAFMQIISNVVHNHLFFLLSCIGLIRLTIKDYRIVLPFLPLIFISIMSFVSSTRFLMYLYPILGIGIGYCIIDIVSFIPFKKYAEFKKYLVSLALGLCFMVFMISAKDSGIIHGKINTGPTVEAYLYNQFLELDDILPQNAAILTWWDYGQAIMYASKRATFHDGMAQNTPKTWLIAKILTEPMDRAYYDISFLLNEGIKNMQAYTFEYNKPITQDNVYIYFTEDMLDKFGAFEQLGRWDIINNKQNAIKGLGSARCQTPLTSVIKCQNLSIDVNIGLVGDIPVASVDYVNINTGNTISTKNTGLNSSYHLIVLLNVASNMVDSVNIINSENYNSLLVQMYILGKYDETKFREMYNRYPEGRAFQVLPSN